MRFTFYCIRISLLYSWSKRGTSGEEENPITMCYTTLHCTSSLWPSIRCSSIGVASASCEFIGFHEYKILPPAENGGAICHILVSGVKRGEAQCSAAQCSALQCSAVEWSAAQCKALQCSLRLQWKTCCFNLKIQIFSKGEQDT